MNTGMQAAMLMSYISRCVMVYKLLGVIRDGIPLSKYMGNDSEYKIFSGAKLRQFGKKIHFAGMKFVVKTLPT